MAARRRSTITKIECVICPRSVNVPDVDAMKMRATRVGPDGWRVVDSQWRCGHCVTRKLDKTDRWLLDQGQKLEARPAKERVSAKAVAPADDDLPRDLADMLDEADQPGATRRTLQRQALTAHAERLRVEVRATCLALYQESVGVPWNDEMAFWVRGPRVWQGIDLVPALHRQPPRTTKPGARKLGDRALMLRFFGEKIVANLALDENGQSAAPPLAEQRNRARRLSANELAVISLLGGNWPGIRITRKTTPAEVIAAEVDHIKEAMSRHARKEMRLLNGAVIPRGKRSRRSTVT